MLKKKILSATAGGLVVLVSLLATLVGCAPAAPATAAVTQVTVPAPAVAAQDDYDYYPGYEVYFSRNRREYVYRDGNRWIRADRPRGITIDLLLAAPSVRVDFHDAPERHHDVVVRTYPRNWKRPDSRRDDRDDKKDDAKRH